LKRDVYFAVAHTTCGPGSLKKNREGTHPDLLWKERTQRMRSEEESGPGRRGGPGKKLKVAGEKNAFDRKRRLLGKGKESEIVGSHSKGKGPELLRRRNPRGMEGLPSFGTDRWKKKEKGT